MHKEIFTKEQIQLLPLVQSFSKDFGLVGGTAIALQIGHRRSIDFDMFASKKFSNGKIKNVINQSKWQISQFYKDELDQLTFILNKVQLTFFHYPHEIKYTEQFDGVRMPNLLTLAAMKAYALAGRTKWKDYVDLYFIFTNFHSVSEVAKKTKELFKGNFNERIFREQLGYFDDINYREPVEFLPGFEVSDKKIKKELEKFSVS